MSDEDDELMTDTDTDTCSMLLKLALIYKSRTRR